MKKREKIIYSSFLLLAALIWGFGFVAQSNGIKKMPLFYFQGIRSFFAFLSLIPLALFMNNKNKDHKEKPLKLFKNALIGGGIGCGVLMFFAANLQNVGLVYTSTGKSAFITTLYLMFVPIIGIFLKHKIGALVWVAVILSTIGMYFLSFSGGISKINIGDLITLLCSVFFAFHILYVDSLKTSNIIAISSAQFLVCSIISLFVAIIFERVTLDIILGGALPILYAGIVSAGLGYTFQMLGQQKIPPATAGVLFSLESVFGAISGYLFLGENLKKNEIVGCIIMFVAVIVVQIPEFFKKKV